MAKRALITGITGQDGAYLSKLLLEKGYEVHGGVRRIGVISTGRLDELDVTDSLTLHDFELLEESNIRRVLEKIAPDEVYNLAAQSFVAVSFEQPIYTSNADALGVARMLECIRSLGGKSRFYQASTSEMFGKVQAIPQSEATPFYPRSPYGVAKLFGHWSTVNYRESFDMYACSGILFNHESPLRGKEFVTRKITLAFARIAAGQQDVLELGNLDAKRDWGYAADYVEGMWRMLQQEEADDYVLATGETHSIRSFVEAAGRYFGWEFDWKGEGANEIGIERKSGRTLVRVNPAFYRPAEVDLLIGDPAKAENKLGWKRSVDLSGLVELMCDADMKRTKGGPIAF
ncbi:MAG: GDP-mannose 4,6-dehydratase [Hyphomonas sp.]